MIYYIDHRINIGSEELYEKFIFISPVNFLELDRIGLDDCLIVPCELNINTKNEQVSRTDFYGISFVQELRRKNYKNKVLFVSFLPEKYYKEKILNSKILFFPGHGFTQLPLSIPECLDEFKNISSLSDLSLYDLKHHYCGINQIIDEQIHSLTPKFNAEKKVTISLIQEGSKLVQLVYNSLNKPIPNLGTILNTNLSGADALRSLRSLCENALPESEREQMEKLQVVWKNWKILWLDDEVNKESPLFKELVLRLGSEEKIILCKTYEEAVEQWEVDKAYGDISLTICDYRLKDQDGIPTSMQGYDFINFLAKTGRTVGKIAYSGLKRKFLIESFRHYGVQTNIYSKIDFNEYNPIDLNFLVDEIIRLGDSHWIELNNAPQAKEWPNLAPAYLQFKNGHKFYSFQSHISRLAMLNLEIFFDTFNNQKTKQDIWKLTFTDSFKVRTGNFPIGVRNKEEAIKDILITRRFAIGLYAFLKSPKNKQKLLLSTENYLDYIKVVLYNSSSNGKGFEVVPFSESTFYGNVKKNSTLKLIPKFSALTFDSTWPLGLLPEEFGWLKFDMGLVLESHDEIHNYLLQIQIVKKHFQELFSKEPFSDLLSKENGILEISGETIQFNDDNCPLIRSSSDAKKIVQKLYSSIDINDFHTNRAFIIFWRKLVSQLTKGTFKTSGLLSDLLGFITQTMSAQKLGFEQFHILTIACESETVLRLLKSLLSVCEEIHKRSNQNINIDISNISNILGLRSVSAYSKGLIKNLLNAMRKTDDITDLLGFIPILIEKLQHEDYKECISFIDASPYAPKKTKYSIEFEYILMHRPWEILFSKKQRLTTRFEEASNELLNAIISKDFDYQNSLFENNDNHFSDTLTDLINIYHSRKRINKNLEIYLRAVEYNKSRSHINKKKLIDTEEKGREFMNKLSAIEFAERKLAQKNLQEQIELLDNMLDEDMKYLSDNSIDENYEVI